MYQAKRALFMYTVSPVHMGAGTALGLIDNPIQREVHTGHPVFAGSGIKGAIRQHLDPSGVKDQEISRLFGPEPEQTNKLHAGAVSFADAQLVLFPIRSLKGGFVYATSHDTLARARRRLQTAGIACDFAVPETAAGKALVSSDGVLADGKLVLETWRYEAAIDNALAATAAWLAANVMPGEPAFAPFRAKMARDLVVLPEDDLAHFAENACSIEPHVRIDKLTGTASDGGLFYTENLPPEGVMLSLAMTSSERSGRKEERLSADEVLQRIVDPLDGQLLQLGGDATTGRGQVILRFCGEAE